MLSGRSSLGFRAAFSPGTADRQGRWSSLLTSLLQRSAEVVLLNLRSRLGLFERWGIGRLLLSENARSSLVKRADRRGRLYPGLFEGAGTGGSAILTSWGRGTERPAKRSRTLILFSASQNTGYPSSQGAGVSDIWQKIRCLVKGGRVLGGFFAMPEITCPQPSFF